MNLKSYIKELISSRKLHLCILLLISIKIPYTLLFKELDWYSYLFLFCGFYSGFSVFFLTLAKQDKPSVKSFCISVAVGALISLFLYNCKCNYLLDLSLSISLPFCVLGVFDKLPKFTLLDDLELKIKKLNVNFKFKRLSFSDFNAGFNKLKFGNKITQGGFPDSQLQDSSSKSTIHLSERANGKKYELGGYSQSSSLPSYEEYSGSKKVYNMDITSMTDNQYTLLGNKLIRGVKLLIDSRYNLTLKDPTVKQPLIVTLNHLGVKLESEDGKLITQFARDYLNSYYGNKNPKVEHFCKTVTGRCFQDASIYNTTDIGKRPGRCVIESDILNAIALHGNNK